MILFRSVNRDLRRHPGQALLSVVGIALGVAVVLAVDLTNYSAERAMQWSQRALAQDTTHQVVAGPNGVPETSYVHLRKGLGIRKAIPVVSGPVRVNDSRERWQLWGVDALAGGDVLSSDPGVQQQSDLVLRLLTERNAVVMSQESAQRLRVNPDDTIAIHVGNRIHEARLIATTTQRDPLRASALAKVIVTDIATAQELLDMSGRLSRIDLILADQVEFPRRIRRALPPGAQLIANTQHSDALAQMTDAFQTNLTALSLLALLLGAFLIFNTMTLSILRRRRTIAILRSLGVSRGELLLLVLSEAALLGAFGTALGTFLGIWLSHGLLDLVTRTINDLYFSLELGSIALGSPPFIKSILLGIGASLVASLVPAIEAVRTPPGSALARAGLEIKARRRTWHWLFAGITCGLFALALLWASERSLITGFLALFALILAFTFSAPAALLWLVRTVRPALVRVMGLYGAMAARGISASLSRTQVAVAALALAVATSLAVTIMIDSFRATVNDWLHYYLRADVYIAKDPTQAKSIDLSVLHRLRQSPEVSAVHTGRWLRLPTPEPTALFVIDVDKRGFAAYRITQRASEKIWEDFFQQQAVIVSEPFAYHRGLRVGGRITLPTERGRQAFKIVAIFEDYGSDRGVVVMHRKTYQHYWQDPTITSLAVYLQPDQDSERFVQRLQEKLEGTGLRIRSNRTLRELSLSIFDQTFVVTGVLRILAIVIAVIGIFSALLAIQLDREREFAVLRALGLTPRDLRQLLTTESGLLGFSAGVLALPLAVAMAWGLIYVINRRAFGWSLSMDVSLSTLAGGVLLAVIASIIAGWYPAQRMKRTAPAVGLRYE